MNVLEAVLSTAITGNQCRLLSQQASFFRFKSVLRNYKLVYNLLVGADSN